MALEAGQPDSNASQAKVRLAKRGPRAWDSFERQRAPSLRAEGTTRLLSHAVADRTFKQWDPKGRHFLLECLRSNIPLRSSQDIGMALAEHMDFQCYGLEREAATGSALMHGLLLIAPELRGHLPLSDRSLQAWAGYHRILKARRCAKKLYF